MTQTAGPDPHYLQYSPQGLQPIQQTLIDEQAVTLSVNGADWLTFQCTPATLQELAVGFLFNEAIIKAISEIEHARVCDDHSNVDIWLTHAAERPPTWQRTSGCTGGASATLPTDLAPLPVDWEVSPNALLAGMTALYQGEGLYQQYRGLHCSALFDGERIRLHAADIGRHNTLDKLAGMWMISGERVEKPTLLTTGRVSSEMLHKAARMGCGVVVSRTTPTRLAVRSAQALRVTLVGYARRDSFVIYAAPERIRAGMPAGSPQAFDQDQAQTDSEG
jgi:FdhD protein